MVGRWWGRYECGGLGWQGWAWKGCGCALAGGVGRVEVQRWREVGSLKHEALGMLRAAGVGQERWLREEGETAVRREVREP